MKKEVFVCSLAFMFLFVSLVSAGCDDSQTMFRLYQHTNSHAAIWNQTSYGIQFCYNDTFGAYSGLNPHNCTGTNTLFYLTADYNSHISNSNANGYNIPVCYGDLSCTISASACSAEYKNISRLYNYTNTHMSNLSDTNYPYYLCCKKQISGPVFSTSLKWKDLVGNDISSANVSDTVALYFGSEGVNFSIVREDIRSIVYTGLTSEKFAVWKAVAGIYSFNITDSSGTYYSANITIAGTHDASPSLSNIANPLSSSLGANYSVNCDINFSHNSTDTDDLLNIIWDFANGTGSQITYPGYSLLGRILKGTPMGDILKSYSSSGVYDVRLFTRESDRSLSTTSYTRVVVLKEGINVVPIISSPERGKSLGTDVVLFDASQTYVVNCSQTMAPFNFTTACGGLKCKYLHAPGSFTRQNLPSAYKLNFKWDLGDGRTMENTWTNATYDGIVQFVYKYADEGEHTAKLEVTYI